ncbi:MAG: class B sortase [Candidatus Limivicinus sp.]
MSKTAKVIIIILCIIFLAVFIFSGWKLFSILNEYKVARNSYSDMSDTFVTSDSKKPLSTEEGGSENADEKEEEYLPITVDFDALLKESEEVTGWIYCEDTVINYPIAQGEDNNQYLHHLLNGDYNASGTLFMDCECAPNFAGANSIIYGHNMKDGSMFHSLLNYRDQEYYDAHPVLYLSTPAQDYKVEIFTAYTCSYDSDTYMLSFANEDDYGAYLEKMKSQSDFDCDVEVDTTERVLTLSTCTYEYDNARYVVQGKLVPLERKA